jgi:Uma2 family endonuclease
MLVDIPQRPLSLEQYFALYPPDGTLVELVDGVAVTMNSPTGPHQRLISRLAQLLAPACPAGFEAVVGPVDWVLWEVPRPTVRIPDLVVIREDQADAVRLTDPPLLAVEVLSPYSYERDVIAKRQQYAQAGLAHYWIANPETGSIVRYGRQGGAGHELVEVGRLLAGHPATITEPFTVTFDAGSLVGPRRG